MSAEIFESGLQQQLYSSLPGAHSRTVFRRIGFFVALFVVCMIATTVPSWTLLQPFQADARKEARIAVPAPSFSPAAPSLAPSSAPSQTTSPSPSSLAAIVSSAEIEQQQALALRLVPPAHRWCVARLFLLRDELLALKGFSWSARDSKLAAALFGSATNSSFVPEVFAPLPSWSNAAQSSRPTPLLDDLSASAPPCRGEMKRSPDWRRAMSLLAHHLTANAESAMRRRSEEQSSPAVVQQRAHMSPPSTIFSQRATWKCLRGKALLFIGSSNTRTLMTNVQARLEGTSQMSRVAAKQLCDDSVNNHSCSVRVSASRFNKREKHGDDKGNADDDDVRLHYIGYKNDLYDASLKSRVDSVFFSSSSAMPDVVIMNTGINSIQKNPSWQLGREAKMAALLKWIESLHKRKPCMQFVWHSTSTLCPNMPHFRRYKFKKGAWSGQTVDAVNAAVKQSNAQVVATQSGGFSFSQHVRHIDVESLLDSKRFAAALGSSSSESFYAQFQARVKPETPLHCRFFEDPLHHRFLDRATVDVLMTMIC